MDIPVEFAAEAVPPVTLHVSGDVYGEAAVQERPHLTSSATLAYPAALLLSHVPGRVVVQAVVDTTGRVEEGSVRVLQSSDARFNQAAEDYVKAARFTAGRIAGRGVRVLVELPVEFKLPTRD